MDHSYMCVSLTVVEWEKTDQLLNICETLKISTTFIRE
jgi:hypothetical protein